MTLDALKDLSLTIVVLTGALALLALLGMFFAFLGRAWVVMRKSWKPTPPRALCPHCGAPLPTMPTCAGGTDDGRMIFSFQCPGCQKLTSIEAAPPHA